MPRRARELSASGIYHIMLKEAIRLEIFHDEEDYQRFLETVDRYKKKSGMKVHGWCLMGNHEAWKEISKVADRCEIAQIKSLPKVQRDQVVARVKG